MSNKFLYLIFTVGISIRLCSIFIFPPPEIGADAWEYDTIAYNIVNGFGFSIKPGIPTPVRAPGYPFFLSIIYFLFGHNYTAVKIVQSIIDAITCIIIFLIAKEIFNKKIAKLSSIFYAIYPVSIAYNNLILSEILFTFVFALAIFLLIKGYNKKNTLHFVFSGLLLGIATLCRPTTLLFPFFLFLIPLIFIFTKHSSLKSLFNYGIFIIISLIVFSPWTLRNYKLFKSFVPVSTGGGFGVWTTGYAVSKNVSWDEAIKAIHKRIEGKMDEPEKFIVGYHPRIELDKELLSEGKEMIKKNFRKYIVLIAKRLPRFWWTSHSSVFGVDRPIREYLQQKNYLHLSVRLSLLTLHGIFLILALLGIFLSMNNWDKTLILIFILIYFSGHIAFDPCPRYHLPAMPYIFIFVSYSIANIWERTWKIKKIVP